MAQLPPKIPNIATPNWSKFGYQKMPTISNINENQQQLSWIEEFLDFSSTKRGVHRRSASVDSVTFLEEEPPLMSEFDRFDDHQLMSIFSNDIKVTPPLHNNNQSSQSDDNDSNSEEGKLQEVKTEKVEAPPLSAAAEASIVDPKRVKRILANRQSAQRSRVRKMQYISELEKNVTYLQTEVWALSPRVAFLDQQRSILTVDNGALRQRITALTQDKIFKDAHQEALKKEIERLSQVYHQLNLEKIASTSTTPTEAGIATSMESISCEKDKLSDEDQQQQ